MPNSSIKQLLDGAIKAREDDGPIVRKMFELKASDTTLDDNMLRGVAAVMGNLDRGDDVIYPGAFSGRNVLRDFVANGFVAQGHQWSDLPIAMPMSAKEVGNQLQAEALFHSTAAAQDARTVAKERLDNGKSVGLSVGFSLDYDDGCHWFQNGKDLLTHAEGMGCDMDLFDRKAINAHKSYIRGISQVDELYEFSIVCVPMNPKAQASDVKSVTGSRDLPIADRDRSWDAGAARKRLRGDDDTPSERYRRAHMVCDGDADEFGSYKLPFADVVDGKLTAIPRAIFAIAAVLQGSRGGVDLSDSNRSGAKALTEAYYKRMARLFNDEEIEVPWADDADDDADDKEKSFRIALPDSRTIATVREFEAFLREAGFSRKHATAISLHGFTGLQRDAAEPDKPTPPLPDPAEADAATREARESEFRQLSRRLELLRLGA